jgi:hypothetical protein
MKLNFSKTWEMAVRGKTPFALDDCISGIERKDSLKLLGVIFNENPVIGIFKLTTFYVRPIVNCIFLEFVTIMDTLRISFACYFIV